jgi:rhodanese-related sulfurtransferase
MINLIKQILEQDNSAVDYAGLVKQGAIIVDVRTAGEFAAGHISGSINIPLQNLQANLSKIRKDKPVITCCASGARSTSAKSILKASGYSEVYNGGGWMSLKNKIK